MGEKLPKEKQREERKREKTPLVVDTMFRDSTGLAWTNFQLFGHDLNMD